MTVAYGLEFVEKLAEQCANSEEGAEDRETAEREEGVHVLDYRCCERPAAEEGIAERAPHRCVYRLERDSDKQ